MLFTARSLAISATLGLAAAFGVAQTWSAGATYGAVNDVERTFRLDGFHPREVTAWVDFKMEPQAILRASYVNIRTTGDNAGRSISVVSGQPPAPLPDLKVGIQAVTVGVSYTVFEGFFTSGIFAGIGGYRIVPDPTTPELAPYADRRETVFGFHGGVDGDFRIAKRLSVIGRVTFHGILSQSKRSLLSAAAGLAVHL